MLRYPTLVVAVLLLSAVALAACGSARGSTVIEVPVVEGPETFRADVEAAVIALFDLAPEEYQLVRQHVLTVALVDEGATSIDLHAGRVRILRPDYEQGDPSLLVPFLANILVHEATHRARWEDGHSPCTAEEERVAILAGRAAFLKLSDPGNPATATYAKMLQDAADNARPPCTP